VSRLEFGPVRSLFPDIEVWGTPRLPEGGGYVISVNHEIVDGRPWSASFNDGVLVPLGFHECREAAEAACERHRQMRIQ
jgi:hypothetical protein